MSNGVRDTRVPRWREDFPIRWDEDNYLTRRELAKFLTLGSALLAAASATTAIAGRVGAPGEWPVMPLPSADGLLPGSVLLFRYPTDRDPCLLIRAHDGELRAYSQVCTHLSCAVRYEASEDTIACPCHRGFFSVEDGRPTAGPPTRRLPRVRLERRENVMCAVGVEV